MSDKFIKNIHHLLESGGIGINLKMLVEEEEGSEEESDPFGALDKDETNR